MDDKNPNPPPTTEEDEEEHETCRITKVHCDYGRFHAVVSEYEHGRREVDCEKGIKCDRIIRCPFTF
jgi:hypothetical protein